MHAAEDERGAKPPRARWRHVQRHLGRGKRLEAAPEPFQLRIVDASPGAAGINQPPVGVVRREQKRAEPRRDPSGSVQPTTTNSSRFMHLTLTHRPRLPGA